MSDDANNRSTRRVFRLLAEHLGAYLEGDELALETLAEAIDQEHLAVEDLHAASLVLRSLGQDPSASGFASIESTPGKRAQRVLSAEERASMSPEAWGYLLDLQRRGALDPGQVERVLDLLTGSGIRPVSVEFVREVATRVALDYDEGDRDSGPEHGEIDLTN